MNADIKYINRLRLHGGKGPSTKGQKKGEKIGERNWQDPYRTLKTGMKSFWHDVWAWAARVELGYGANTLAILLHDLGDFAHTLKAGRRRSASYNGTFILSNSNRQQSGGSGSYVTTTLSIAWLSVAQPNAGGRTSIYR